MDDLPDPAQILRPSEEFLLGAWARLIDANREQAERLRETPAPDDYWASSTAMFAPGRTAPPELGALRDLTRPDDTWLDVGCGGGRITLPLAGLVRRVVALDSSAAMIAALERAVTAAGVQNVKVLPITPWPPPAPVEEVDVAFSAHVLYFVPEIGAFLDALERHARRLCVVVAGDPAGPTPYPDQWETVHAEPHAALPALRELIALLSARGRRFEVRSIEASAAELRPAPSLEEAMAPLRRRLLTRAGSEKDRRLRAVIAERYTNPDGSVRTGTAMARAAAVSWAPPAPPP